MRRPEPPDDLLTCEICDARLPVVEVLDGHDLCAGCVERFRIVSVAEQVDAARRARNTAAFTYHPGLLEVPPREIDVPPREVEG